MHWNCLLLPLLGLLAVTYAAPEERRKFVRVITEPKPGEEYVSIHTGKPSSGVPAKPLGTKLMIFVMTNTDAVAALRLQKQSLQRGFFLLQMATWR